MSKLDILTRQVQGVVILDLNGSITIGETSDKLRKAIADHLTEGKRSILLDLASVTRVDSSGLGTLVASYASAERNGGVLKLMRLRENVLELMTMTKLYTLFDIFDTEADAIQSFEAGPQSETAAAARPNSVL